MTVSLYGQTTNERRADENRVCRQIVHEVTNFGVTQRQILFVIYLLAAELENIEHMKIITKLIRELGGEQMFISGVAQNGEEQIVEPSVNGG